MSWHIIRAFIRMPKHAVPIRSDFPHEGFKIGAHRRVCVLAQDQRGAGVVYEYLTDALLDARAANDLGDFVRNIRSPASRCAESKLPLVNHTIEIE